MSKWDFAIVPAVCDYAGAIIRHIELCDYRI